MRKEASLPVRLDVDVSRRLDQAAKHLGLTKSALIRIMAKSFVDQIEAEGGKITLPLRWTEKAAGKSDYPLKRVAESREPYGAKAKKS